MPWCDSSALAAVVLGESATEPVKASLGSDDELAVWWGTRVEAISAIFRGRRHGVVRPDETAALVSQLERMLLPSVEIPPSEEVRETACSLLRVHNLRAADALQLAAALVWAEHRPSGLSFVCLDERLREAAAREGFSLLPERE